MAFKTQTIIEIQGDMLHGGVVNGKFLSANSVLQSERKWTSRELKKLREDLNHLIPLLEGVEVADELTEEEGENYAVFDDSFSDDVY